MSIINKYLSPYNIKWLAVILSYNVFVYLGSRFLAEDKIHYDFSLKIDRLIPFVPCTAVIYLGCYVFWAVSYILIIGHSRESAVQFAISEMVGKTVCLLLYVLIPTTMTRAQVTGGGFWPDIVRLVYKLDAPDNLFPSIHCYVSWMCFLGLKDKTDIPKWYKFFSCMMAVLVFVSTLTMKQHVVVDVLAGFILAETVYMAGRRFGKEVVFCAEK